MTIQGVNSSQSLQFQGDLQDTNSKLRRLVQDLVQVETQLNALIAIANQTTPDGPTIAKHVIATTAGLGEFHTTSGLTVGQVLKAISATNAAFDKIKFSDLVDSNISDDPEDGQIIQFVDGFWQAEDVTAIGASSGNNLGVGQGVYVNNTGAVLNFKTLLSLGGIALDIAADTIAVRLGAVPDDTVLGNVSGGTAIPVPLSQTQLRALIGTVDATTAGLAPPSIVVTGQILSDGGWIAPPAGGSITVGDGTTTLTGITDIEFTGATVSSGGAGIADVLISGGSANITPETHPTSPTIYDDEFEASTLDAKWIFFNQGSFVYNIDEGSINFVDPVGGSGAAFMGMLQVAPAAPWTIQVRISADIFDVTNSYAALAVYDSASTVLATIGPMNAGIGNYPILKFTGPFTGNSGTVLNTGLGGNIYGTQTDWCYYQIENDGTSLFFRQSKSGVPGSFRPAFSTTLAGIGSASPTHFGLAANEGYMTKFCVDHFRKTA